MPFLAAQSSILRKKPRDDAFLSSPYFFFSPPLALLRSSRNSSARSELLPLLRLLPAHWITGFRPNRPSLARTAQRWTCEYGVKKKRKKEKEKRQPNKEIIKKCSTLAHRWMSLIETRKTSAQWRWMAKSRWVMALVERFVLLSPSLAAEKPCGEICPSSLTDWLVGEKEKGGGREGGKALSSGWRPH